MSREVRRVPLDFDWPLSKTWDGYFMPDDLKGTDCLDCGGHGYSPEARHLYGQWYGDAPFRPEDNGSTPLTIDTPAVRAFAERNVDRDPGFYLQAVHGAYSPRAIELLGGDAAVRELAVQVEARRLIGMWNEQWSHHLNADDVQALVDAGRLMDFTHTLTKGEGWQPIVPTPIPTPEQVNTWHIATMGHDGLNAWAVLKARCTRDGVPLTCATCDGHGTVWRDADHKTAHDAWEAPEPPTGEGWQLWETVSEGSPITPVCATPEELVEHLTSVGEHRTRGPARPYSREAAEAMVRSMWAPSGISVGGKYHQNTDALVALDQQEA